MPVIVQVDHLAEAICICTADHNPEMRIECHYAQRAAEMVAGAGWGPDSLRRLDLLRAVLSYVDTHVETDLPLTLLEEIRRITGAQV